MGGRGLELRAELLRLDSVVGALKSGLEEQQASVKGASAAAAAAVARAMEVEDAQSDRDSTASLVTTNTAGAATVTSVMNRSLNEVESSLRKTMGELTISFKRELAEKVLKKKHDLDTYKCTHHCLPTLDSISRAMQQFLRSPHTSPERI